MSGRLGRIETRLPIEDHVPGFVADLASKRNGLVVAAPGAGKTTVVPARLLDAAWLVETHRPGIILVQPRRVAALQAAKRLAQSMNETVGQTVGLRMRGDSRVSSATRLSVVTEGVYLRMIQTDPTLAGFGVVMLDEFHERSLNIDTACALTLSARELFAPEIRLVAMSATLDVQTVSALLEHDGPIAHLIATGTSYPVEITYRPLGATPPSRPRTTSERLAEHAADSAIAVVQSMGRNETPEGDILVFLPGVHEIRVAARILSRWEDRNTETPIDILELHSRASTDMVDRALARRAQAGPGKQARVRIVLATSIAQTSVTIDGVTVVIDTGIIRTPQRDASTGLTRLATTEVSQSTADQRSGRAGRTRPGQSIRLWARSDQVRRPSHDHPAILGEDLSGLVLLLAAWGQTADEVRWCDAPLAESIDEAQVLLRSLGALDGHGAITAHGQAMADVPAHPRLAAMLVKSPPEHRALAAAIVALLSDDPWRAGTAPTDLRARLRQVFIDSDPVSGSGSDSGSDGASEIDRIAMRRVRASWLQLLSDAPHGCKAHLLEQDLLLTGRMLLDAYPDRLGVRLVDQPTTYRLASGLELELRLDDDQTPAHRGMQLSGCSLLIATDLDADRRSGRIRMAVPVSLTDLEGWVVGTDSDAEFVTVDAARFEQTRIVASSQTSLTIGGSRLELFTTARPTSVDDRILATLNELSSNNEQALVWSDRSRSLFARLHIAHEYAPDTWPMIDLPALVTGLRLRLELELESRLGARQSGNDRSEATLLDPTETLDDLISEAGQRRTFDLFVPESWKLPDGTTRRINYLDEQNNACMPTVATRVQDLFGVPSHPTVCNGRLPLRLDLLSPAQRSVAVTNDILRFWKVGYPAVRIDMRGRYPRHHWPEDPASPAIPASPLIAATKRSTS